MSLGLPTYEVFPIPVPTADDHIRSYKLLRLTSLKLDPASFSSSYERESKFTDEIWRERVDSSKKVTVIARVKGRAASHNMDGSGIQAEAWVGSATTLSPRMLRDLGYSPPESIEGFAVYTLNGLWVDPEHRSKGLAKRLHEATIEWVRDDQGGANEKKILLVQVKADNGAAYSLYKSLGYREIVSDETVHTGTLSLVLDI